MKRRLFLKMLLGAVAGATAVKKLFSSPEPSQHPVLGEYGQHFYEYENYFKPLNPNARVRIERTRPGFYEPSESELNSMRDAFRPSPYLDTIEGGTIEDLSPSIRKALQS